MSQKIVKAVLSATLTLFSPYAMANLVITVGNGNGASNPITVQSGDTVFIPVTISRTGNSFDLTGFDLAFDLYLNGGSQGFGLPSGLGAPTVQGFATPFNGGALDTSLANAYNAANAPPNFDFTVSATAALNQSNPINSVVTLFQIAVPTGAASEGIYRIDFILNALGGTESIDGLSLIDGSGSPGTLTIYNGSFEITAVPEPSSMLFGAVVSAGVLHRLRRRWKNNKCVASAT